MSEINSPSDDYPIQELESNDYEKEIGEKLDVSKRSNKVRGGKVIINALCTLIQANDNISGQLQVMHNSVSEINLLRQEVIEMNKKLDHLIQLTEKNPDGKSTFMQYFLS